MENTFGWQQGTKEGPTQAQPAKRSWPVPLTARVSVPAPQATCVSGLRASKSLAASYLRKEPTSLG